MILGLLGLGLTLSAQPGTIATRPANCQSGKILTMEETILSRELAPQNLHCSWNSDKDILMHQDGKWMLFNIETRLDRPYRPVWKEEKVYKKGRSLYYQSGNGLVLTIGGSRDENITYGQYVSRNEFGIEDGVFWSPDSTRVAFYKKDESKVASFPLLDITTRTGSLKEIKYPMAGMDSEMIQIGVYNLTRCRKCIISTSTTCHCFRCIIPLLVW